MKVLVTGSAGFIGSALVQGLREKGMDVIGLDIRESRWRETHPDDYRFDITQGDVIDHFVRRMAPSVIVHLAARTDLSSDSVVRYNANVEGVATLMRAAQRAVSVTRVLWTSTQLVSRVGRIPQHDTDYEPDTSYGESKVVGERIVRGMDGGGMEWVILRPTTVWGPGMSDHYISLLRYLERRRYFHVGPGPTLKSYSFIFNAVHQIERLIFAPSEQIHRRTFYIADYKPVDLRQWCDALSLQLGMPASPVMPIVIAKMLARTGDFMNATLAPEFKFNSFRLRNILTPYVFDMSNLEAVVGQLPFDFDAAVRATAAWYGHVTRRATKRCVA